LKVLLIGGFGFIGCHLIEALRGSHSLAVFSDAAGAQRTPGVLSTLKDLAVDIGDVEDSDSTIKAILKHNPHAVVHLAALTGLKRCEENPRLAFSVNVLGTYNVAIGCVACRSKLIFISSREVYGETASTATQEDDPLVPNNLYGITKMLAERIVLWAGLKHNLDYTILRLTNVYGPGGDQYNIQGMIRSAFAKGKIQVLGGKQQLNLVYVRDVAEIVSRALEDDQSSKQILNIGSNDSLSVDDIVQRLVPLLNPKPSIKHVPMRNGETRRFIPSLRKLEKTLQCTPTTSLEQGFRETVEWYRIKRDSGIGFSKPS